jgi:hypothetical protein
MGGLKAGEEQAQQAQKSLVDRLVELLRGDSTNTERVQAAASSAQNQAYLAQQAVAAHAGGGGDAGNQGQPASPPQADEGTRALLALIDEGKDPWVIVLGDFVAKHEDYKKARIAAIEQFGVLKKDGWPANSLAKLSEAVSSEQTLEGDLRFKASKCAEQPRPGSAAQASAALIAALSALSQAALAYPRGVEATKDAIKECAEDAWEWLKEDCQNKLEKLIQQGGNLDQTPVPPEVRKTLEDASAAIEISKAVLLQAGVVLSAVAPLTLGISGVVAGALGLAEMIAEPFIKAKVAKSVTDLNSVLALAGWDSKEKEQRTLEHLETGHQVTDFVHQGADIAKDSLDIAKDLVTSEHTAGLLETGAKALETVLGPAGQMLKSAGYALHCAKEPAELQQYAGKNETERLKQAIQRAFDLQGGFGETGAKEFTVHEFGDPADVSVGGVRGKLYSTGLFVGNDPNRGFRKVCEVLRRDRGWNTANKRFQNEVLIEQTATGYRGRAEVYYARPGGWPKPGMYETTIEVKFEADQLVYPATPAPFDTVVNMQRCTPDCVAMDDDAELIEQAVQLLGNEWLMDNHMDAHPYWQFISVESSGPRGNRQFWMKPNSRFPSRLFGDFHSHLQDVAKKWR